jgi:hypothetical protein
MGLSLPGGYDIDAAYQLATGELGLRIGNLVFEVRQGKRIELECWYAIVYRTL